MTPSPDQPSRPLPAPTARVVRAEVTESPISVTELADAVQDAAAGAVVTFEGVVRNHDAERAVTGIGYSCHPTAGQVVEQIAQDVAQQGRVRALGVVHRVGDLSVGEAALAVAVSSDHRAEAFAVCSEIVEEVKQRLPVWKRRSGCATTARLDAVVTRRRRAGARRRRRRRPGA